MATKSKRPSPGGDGVRESMAELKAYVDQGMTLEDIARHYRKYHPDRIRTPNKVVVGEAGIHTAGSIKRLRISMGISQAVFARGLGVSTVLVQGWEQGVRQPSPLARRLLDIVCRDPQAWLASLTHPMPKSRRAG